MKKHSIYIVFLIGVLSWIACEEVRKTEPQKLQWMAGHWEMETPSGMLYEDWDYSDQKTLKGSTVSIEEGDTTFFESAMIIQTDSGTFYSVSVNKQDDVLFKLTDNSQILGKTAGVAVFENKEHDFPQRIIYYTLQGDSLYARIEGLVDGQFQKEEYYYSRRKN